MFHDLLRLECQIPRTHAVMKMMRSISARGCLSLINFGIGALFMFPSPNVLYPICNITGTEVYEQEHTSLTVRTKGQVFTVYLLYTEDFYF